jgi:hypothetical protein
VRLLDDLSAELVGARDRRLVALAAAATGATTLGMEMPSGARWRKGSFLRRWRVLCARLQDEVTSRWQATQVGVMGAGKLGGVGDSCVGALDGTRHGKS